MAGPWWAQNIAHVDLHDPVWFTVWVGIGSGSYLLYAADRIADAIQGKK
jgi:hypothetical protein